MYNQPFINKKKPPSSSSSSRSLPLKYGSMVVMIVIKPFLHPCNLFDELAFKENLAKSSFRNLGNLQELLKSTNQLNLPEKGIWRQQIWNRKDLERLTKRVNKSMLMYYANQPYANIITNQCFCNSYVISSSLHPCEVGRKSFKLS